MVCLSISKFRFSISFQLVNWANSIAVEFWTRVLQCRAVENARKFKVHLINLVQHIHLTDKIYQLLDHVFLFITHFMFLLCISASSLHTIRAFFNKTYWYANWSQLKDSNTANEAYQCCTHQPPMFTGMNVNMHMCNHCGALLWTSHSNFK